MIGIVLIVLLILLLAGGGYGYRSGWYGGPAGAGYNPLGIVLLVVLLLVVFGLLGGPHFGLYHW